MFHSKINKKVTKSNTNYNTKSKSKNKTKIKSKTKHNVERNIENKDIDENINNVNDINNVNTNAINYSITEENIYSSKPFCISKKENTGKNKIELEVVIPENDNKNYKLFCLKTIKVNIIAEGIKTNNLHSLISDTYITLIIGKNHYLTHTPVIEFPGTLNHTRLNNNLVMYSLELNFKKINDSHFNLQSGDVIEFYYSSINSKNTSYISASGHLRQIQNSCSCNFGRGKPVLVEHTTIMRHDDVMKIQLESLVLNNKELDGNLEFSWWLESDYNKDKVSFGNEIVEKVFNETDEDINVNYIVNVSQNIHGTKINCGNTKVNVIITPSLKVKIEAPLCLYNYSDGIKFSYLISKVTSNNDVAKKNKYYYQWMKDDKLIENQNSEELTINSGGTYTSIVSDDDGNVGVSSHEVKVYNCPTAKLEVKGLCFDSDMNLKTAQLQYNVLDVVNSCTVVLNGPEQNYSEKTKGYFSITTPGEYYIVANTDDDCAAMSNIVVVNDSYGISNNNKNKDDKNDETQIEINEVKDDEVKNDESDTDLNTEFDCMVGEEIEAELESELKSEPEIDLVEVIDIDDDSN